MKTLYMGGSIVVLTAMPAPDTDIRSPPGCSRPIQLPAGEVWHIMVPVMSVYDRDTSSTPSYSASAPAAWATSRRWPKSCHACHPRGKHGRSFWFLLQPGPSVTIVAIWEVNYDWKISLYLSHSFKYTIYL